MKLALISPIPYLSKSIEVSNYHMVLGHLLKDEIYNRFYQDLKINQPDSYVICDNSANEGFMLKGQELIDLAKYIKADEIIAPDKYHDAETTVKETMSFLDDHWDKQLAGKFKIMAVPQGETMTDYFDCYGEFLDDDRIDVIGIGYRNLIPAFIDAVGMITPAMWEQFGLPKEIVDVLFSKLEDNCFSYTMSRLYFLKNLVKFKTFAHRSKQIHLLGLYNPYELHLINTLFAPAELKRIRSCDTAAPWQAAQANVAFNKDFGVVTKPKAFVDFKQTLTDNQMVLFAHNMGLLKKWSRNE
jgi:hypothetical protein